MKNILLLMIEDSKEDASLILSELRKNDYNVDYQIVDSEKSFKEALYNKKWDAIVADYFVPGFEGKHSFKILKESGIDIPFIVVSGAISAEDAVKILKAGAHDYIDKSNLLRLPSALEREIKDAADRKIIRENEIELKESAKVLKIALEQTIETIAVIIEKKDPYTSGHQKKVALLAVEIAKELKLSEERIEILKFSSLIHDLGKITIPSSILSKPGKLNDIEIEMIKEHPANGYEILRNNNFMENFSNIIKQHHERMDGSGYPGGLKGDEIIFEARIIGVADVVEAMSSHRPYRPALGIDQALKELELNSGILYDSKIVDTCIKIFRKNKFKF